MATIHLLIVVAIATLCPAAPLVDNARDAQIIEYRSESDGYGGYHFAYRTSDGTYREEKGVLKYPGTREETMEVTGLTTWFAADGREYSVSFLANENGYVPTNIPEQRPSSAEHTIMAIGVLPPKIRRKQSIRQ